MTSNGSDILTVPSDDAVAVADVAAGGADVDLILVNNGDPPIHIGPDDTVDTSAGRILPGASISLRVRPDTAWWATAASGGGSLDRFWSAA